MHALQKTQTAIDGNANEANHIVSKLLTNLRQNQNCRVWYVLMGVLSPKLL
jgi:hypothetical protein